MTGTITASGIGSGIDIAGLVEQLVTAERQPKELNLAQKEVNLQTELSSIGTLSSALSELQTSIDSLKDADNYKKRTASSSDSAIFTATATDSAVAGSYDIEVVKEASAHKLRSGSFANSSVVLGEGTLTIEVNSKSFNLTIDNTNSTLAGIRDAINNASDNVGVSATILTLESGSQLILSSNETGLSNAIKVTVTGDSVGTDIDNNGLSQLVYDSPTTTNLTQLTAAEDAEIKIDTQTAKSANNVFTDVIEGVTLTVNSVPSPSTTEKLTIGLDSGTINSQVSTFVTAYNNFLSTVSEISGYNKETEVAGPLLGDSLVRTMTGTFRGLIGFSNKSLTGGINNLTDLGMSTNNDGTLSLDSAKLSTALDTSFEEFEKFFTGDKGFGTSFDNSLKGYTEINGLIDLREDSINARLDRIGDERIQLNDRMVKFEARLQAQFGALDSLVAELRSQGDFLTQQLDNLPGFTRKSSK